MKKEEYVRQYPSLKKHADYVKILQLEKLTKKQKELILNKLYIQEYNNLSVEIDLIENDKKITGVDVQFMNNGMPDLCVSHFGYNFYFRTKKGINKEKYKTLGQAISALKKLLIKHGYTHTSNLRFYRNGYNVFNLEFNV